METLFYKKKPVKVNGVLLRCIGRIVKRDDEIGWAKHSKSKQKTERRPSKRKAAKVTARDPSLKKKKKRKIGFPWSFFVKMENLF